MSKLARESLMKKVAEANTKIFNKKKVDYELDYLNKNQNSKAPIPKNEKNNNDKRNHSNNAKAVRENYFDAELMQE